MPKVIQEISVNDRNLSLLIEYKDRQFAAKKEAHDDLFPPLLEALRQIRELTQNIAIISGAIAAFTIPVVNTSFVQIKFLAYVSLVLLFVTICYAIHHLTHVITKEVNELSKQHSTFMEIYDNEIDRVNTIIESGDIESFAHNDEEKQNILNQLNSLKTLPEPDKSLDYLRNLLIAALTILTLSFVPIYIYELVFCLMLEYLNISF